MAKNYSYQQPANTSSMLSSYSVYNQPQQSNNNQPQQNTSQPQRNNSQQSSYAAPQPQQQAAPINMAAYSPPPQQAARTYSPGQAQGIEPRSNGTPYMPPGAVRETSDFLAPEVRARLAAPAEPQAGFEPWLNPQPQQSPASGRDAWNQAGRPGWDPNGMNLQVTGTAKDGTEFGLRAEADAYDKWRAGSAGNAQPNPTQPPPYGRFGGPQQDRLMPAQPVAPPYNPAYGNMDQMPTVLIDPAKEQRFKDGKWGGDVMGFLEMEDRRWRAEKQAGRNPNGPYVDDKGRTVEIPMPQPAAPADGRYATLYGAYGPPRIDTPRGVPLTAEQRSAMETVYPSAAPPQSAPQPGSNYSAYGQARPAPQPGQNSYGFRGYDINNGYSIRPEASPANAANFGFGPKPNLFSQSFTSPDGTTSDQPNFNQRDAFLNNLLDHDSENPGGMYQGSGRAPQSFMNPRPDIMGMWNKAGSMARDGWTNPVAGLMNQSR